MVSSALYAHEPRMLKDRSFELTTLGPYILAWQDWLEYRGLADSTVDGYERDMAKVAEKYPDLAPEDFDDALLIKVSLLWPKAARRTRMESVRSFFKFCRMRKLISANPFEDLEPIKRAARKRHDVFSDTEVDDLYALPIGDAALMALMIECGPRKAECRHALLRRITLDDESETGQFAIVAGKGGKDRTVHFGSKLYWMLRELTRLEDLGPNDYLWYTRPGGGAKVNRSRPIGNGSFARWWERTLDKAHVRYRNPHTTRHSFATRWLLRGGRLETLSQQMGHSSIAVTADEYGYIATEMNVRRDVALMEINPQFAL